MGVSGVLGICFKDNEVTLRRLTLDKPQRFGLFWPGESGRLPAPYTQSRGQWGGR